MCVCTRPPLMTAKTDTYYGYWGSVSVYRDDIMGPPWEEHDGHGPVSEWTTRDKRPGEWVLSVDGPHKRYYDAEMAQAIARRYGWGFEGCAESGLTKRQIAAEAVRRDFRYLKAWCDDEWCWLEYDMTIYGPDGQEVDERSLCGIDDEEYLLEECEAEVERIAEEQLLETLREGICEMKRAEAVCWP